MYVLVLMILVFRCLLIGWIVLCFMLVFFFEEAGLSFVIYDFHIPLNETKCRVEASDKNKRVLSLIKRKVGMKICRLLLAYCLNRGDL